MKHSVVFCGAALTGNMAAAASYMAQPEVRDMVEKLSAPLVEQVEAAEASGSPSPIAVIVTLAPGANASRLSGKGLTLETRSEREGIYSVSLPPAEIRRLAASDAVHLIEPDGPVRALGGPVRALN